MSEQSLSEKMRELGRRGGKATLAKYGHNHYVAVGGLGEHFKGVPLKNRPLFAKKRNGRKATVASPDAAPITAAVIASLDDIIRELNGEV